jgi:hypothetical protein
MYNSNKEQRKLRQDLIKNQKNETFNAKKIRIFHKQSNHTVRATTTTTTTKTNLNPQRLTTNKETSN